MTRIRFILLLCLVFLSACATSGDIFVMDSYRKQNLACERLLIGPVLPAIDNPDDVLDDLGPGSVEDTYFSFFESEFSNALTQNGNITHVIINRDSLNIPLKDTLVEVSSYKYRLFSMPHPSAAVLLDSLKFDYVLTLNRFRIYRPVTSPSTSTFPSRQTNGSAEQLRHELQFVLWDAGNNCLISYGLVQADSRVNFFAMTKDNWKESLTILSKKILAATPFLRNP